MAIRVKNIDYTTDAMKLHASAYFGVLSASIIEPIFIAPCDCKIEIFSVYTHTTTAHSASQSCTMTFLLNGTAICDYTQDWSGSIVHTILADGNNSLTKGAAVIMNWSSVCQVLSGVRIDVQYIPLANKKGL